MAQKPKVKYPDITVQLSDQNGQGFAIVARTIEALEGARVPQDQIDLYQTDAVSGDYGHLLRVTMDWVNVK